MVNLSSVLFLLIGMFLLSSLANFAAFKVTDVVKILLLSTFVLRVIESLQVSLFGSRISSVFSMPSNIVPILFAGILLELLSMGFRSISLGFRLFANISAGHVLSDIAAVLKFSGSAGFLSLLASFLHQFFILAYETGVSAVQLGVFLALTGVYAA